MPMSQCHCRSRLLYVKLETSVPMSLKCDMASLDAFSIALDDSTVIRDNPQLAVFVRYVSKHFCVEEELFD